MLQRPVECYGCSLHENKVAIGFMKPEGTGSLGVAVMAEALGAKEASEGLPLRPNAPAGSIFQGILRRAGIDRAQLLLTNTIWCQPGPHNWLEGRHEEYSAIRHCQVHNAKLMEERRPRAILAMGNIPMRTLTGLVGHNLGIKMVRGFIIPGLGPDRPHDPDDDVPWGDNGPVRFPAAGIPVIPTYHPSYLLRGSKTRSKETGGKTEKAEGGMALAGVLRRDLELAIQVAKNGYSRPKVNYRFLTTREEAEVFYEECKANSHLSIGVDIETPESRSKADDESEIVQVTLPVTQIQFSVQKNTGVVFPGFDVEWSRDVSTKILALPNDKYTWNGWSFDEPNLGQYGIKLAGVHHDLMWAWHFLQPDLPKGLQYATSFYAPEMGPWKHLAGVDDHFYGGCDVDSLHRDAEGIFSALKGRGLYNTYDRHVLQLHSVLTRASDRGIPVNSEKQEVFGDFLVKKVAELDGLVQKHIPVEIRPLKQKGGLTKCPKTVAATLPSGTFDPLPGTVVVVENELHCAICEVSQKNHATAKDALAEPHEAEWVPDVYIFKEVEWKVKEDKSKGSLDELTEKGRVERGLRWAKVMDFSVNSGDQIKAYILHKQGEEMVPRLAKGQDRSTALRLCKYQIPMVKDKENRNKLKESTEAKELMKLGKKTGDPLFNQIIEIRQMKKMKATYIDGWKPDKNGLVHTEFLMAPATGQLSSVAPNIQNVPKHGELGDEFRKTIEAWPDRVLLEFDKKSFHAQTLAFEAQDPNYFRLSKIDIHSYVTCHMIQHPQVGEILSWSDKDLTEFLDRMKADKKTLFRSAARLERPNGSTFKQIRDEQAKKTILGIGFGQGANSIYAQNEENFESAKDVQRILDIIKEQFKPVFKFQDNIRGVAHSQGWLISRFKYIRRFHDVYQWDPEKWNPNTGSMGGWKPGDDSEAAIAFFPANDAFGMIKEEMLRLEEGGWNETFGFCNQIHDALKFHCPVELEDACIETVVGEMSKPSPYLIDPVIAPGGLAIEVGVVRGRNWAHYDKAKNPEGMQDVDLGEWARRKVA